MKVDKRQVVQTVNVYIANDGTEFDTAKDCKDYEYKQALHNAKTLFDFKFTDFFEDEFILVYREEHVNEFAVDLSVIINNCWDVAHTNMARDYDSNAIIHSLEHEFCGKFIDGHTYLFNGYLIYTDEDHAYDFCMDIVDITGVEVKKQDQLKQKDRIEDIISDFIVNKLGINLCSVRSIEVNRQEDGQIEEIRIEFIPAEKV